MLSFIDYFWFFNIISHILSQSSSSYTTIPKPWFFYQSYDNVVFSLLMSQDNWWQFIITIACHQRRISRCNKGPCKFTMNYRSQHNSNRARTTQCIHHARRLCMWYLSSYWRWSDDSSIRFFDSLHNCSWWKKTDSNRPHQSYQQREKKKYEAEMMKNEEKKLREEETKKKFTDRRLASIKEVMNYLSDESTTLIERSRSYNDTKKTKSFADALDEVKKVRMGTNIDKMINACDAVYSHIESFLQTKHNNPNLTKPIQWSTLTHQDIIDTLIAYHKSHYVKLSFTPHSWDDRLFFALEKWWIFRKLFGLEKKQVSGGTPWFLGHTILASMDMAWTMMWVWIGLMSLRLQITQTTNPIIYLIFLYYGLWSISRWISRRLVHVTDMQTLSIWAWFFGAICIWCWYLVTKNFGL